MAERKAVNKYYPPSWDPSKGSVNQFRGQHPLRDRARKLDQGILVVRFEMPFNIWCGQCERHIAKGVRFNAEKKAIGKYFTTKIWEFSMRCPSCSNLIQIQTDPKNTEYIVSSGGRRKVEDYDAEEAETIEFMDDATRNKMQNNPMFALDIRGANKKKADTEADQIRELLQQQSQLLDDYSLSRKLRKTFREAKKAASEEQKAAERDFLPYPLLPESEHDEQKACSIWFGKSVGSDHRKVKRLALACAPIFKQSSRSSATAKDKGFASVNLALKKHIDLSAVRPISTKKSSAEVSVRKRQLCRESNENGSLVAPNYGSSESE